MATTLRTITANEARAYLSGDWREKLNEIYDSVRAMLEKGEDNCVFRLDDKTPFSNEIVLKQLRLDGYRLVEYDTDDNFYAIFW